MDTERILLNQIDVLQKELSRVTELEEMWRNQHDVLRRKMLEDLKTFVPRTVCDMYAIFARRVFWEAKNAGVEVRLLTKLEVDLIESEKNH